MTSLLYDGSFEGLLTAIFEVYEYKIADPSISKEAEANSSLFGIKHLTHTNIDKAARVLNKIQEKSSRAAFIQIYRSFLSEMPAIETHILRYIQYILNAKTAVENDYSNPEVLLLQQISRKVHREKHRMEAFVRFQLTKDGLYYSIIQPDYNVLPLIGKHFKDRYGDQRWLIYDSRRKYGLYYDLEQVMDVQMEFDAGTNDKSHLATVHDEKEALYQTLWQQYFSSVTIAARKNLKLHIRHMPKRYWKNLIEKRIGIESEEQ